MKATKSLDGKYRIDLRITHRVGVSELADVLASAYRNHRYEDGPLPTLTAKATQSTIRAEMVTRGEMTEGWASDLGMTETNQRLAWAEEHVRRAYPELVNVEPTLEDVQLPMDESDREHAVRLSLDEALEYADQMRRDATVVGLPNWPAPCKHGNTPRPDVTGDPVKACVTAASTTEWGAFNAEGCTYSYDCAVDVANESAKENEEAESTPDDPESRWHEMCRDHAGEPKDGCAECFTETDEDLEEVDEYDD